MNLNRAPGQIDLPRTCWSGTQRVRSIACFLFERSLRAHLLTEIVAAQEHVSFPTRDGGHIDADLYRKGDRGVLLAHRGRLQPGARGKKRAEHWNRWVSACWRSTCSIGVGTTRGQTDDSSGRDYAHRSDARATEGRTGPSRAPSEGGERPDRPGLLAQAIMDRLVPFPAGRSSRGLRPREGVRAEWKEIAGVLGSPAIWHRLRPDPGPGPGTRTGSRRNTSRGPRCAPGSGRVCRSGRATGPSC